MIRGSNVIPIYNVAFGEYPKRKQVGYAFWNAEQISAQELERLKTFFDHCNFVSPVVFVNRDCELAKYLDGKGIVVEVLNGKNIIESNRGFYNLVKSYNLEFVQCYGRGAFEHYAFVAKLAGLKTVCNLPEVRADYTRGRINSVRDSLLLMLSDKILVNSKTQYDTLEEQSRRLFASMQMEFSKKVAVVKHGINLERYYPVDVIDVLKLRQKLGINLDAKVVVFLGDFSPRNKQLDFLQQVCLKFSASVSSGQGRRTDFYFATQDALPHDLMSAEADGTLKPSMQSYSYLLRCCDLIDSLNLRGQIFLEAVGKEQRFLDLLGASDIAVLSPEVAQDEELLAKVLSLGKPIVTISDVTQTTAFIEEHSCGYSCHTSDLAAVFNGLYGLVQNDILYKQCCNNAKMIAKHMFDANYATGEYEREVL